MRRVFWPLLILALVGGYMLLLETGAPSPNIAHHSDGESWYRIEQNGQHIGYMRNTVHGFALTTEINYHPPDAPAVVINQQLHFASTTPWQLRRAAYSQRVVNNAGMTILERSQAAVHRARSPFANKVVLATPASKAPYSSRKCMRLNRGCIPNHNSAAL